MPGILDLLVPRKRVTFSVDTGEAGFFIGNPVTLDASTDETHSSESEITDFPVEEGANISDNSRPKPARLTIQGVVTGTPLDITAIALPPSIKKARGKDAWESLNQWRYDGKRLRVSTTLKEYRGMVIQGISVSRNAKNTDGVQMTITLQEVFTVLARTQAVEARQERLDKKPRKNDGPKSTTEATPAQSSTILTKITGLRG